MNIAVFSWEALEGLAVGGGAVYASRLAAAMARAGHRVRLFTRLGDGQAMDEIVDGVYVRRCPWDRQRVFIDEIAALAHSFDHYAADAMKADGPYDLVICHEWLTIAAGIRAAARCRARLAVTFHSTEWARTGAWPDAGDSARIAGLERQGIEQADAVIAASQWVRRKIHEQFHPPDWKCEVVYHGADLPADPAPDRARALRETTGIAADAPVVLFAGVFSRPGGGDLAARACRVAAESFPDARFLFVGSGPLAEEMRREIGAAGVFLPPKGRVVPPEFYGEADLVLAPFRRDHSGRAVLPAWAAATPVAVLSDTVPAEFILPETNGWVVPDDADALATVIAGALSQPEQTAWMGRNGRVAAETAFTWEGAAGKLLAAASRKRALSPEGKVRGGT